MLPCRRPCRMITERKGNPSLRAEDHRRMGPIGRRRRKSKKKKRQRGNWRKPRSKIKEQTGKRTKKNLDERGKETETEKKLLRRGDRFFGSQMSRALSSTWIASPHRCGVENPQERKRIRLLSRKCATRQTDRAPTVPSLGQRRFDRRDGFVGFRAWFGQRESRWGDFDFFETSLNGRDKDVMQQI